MPVSDNWSPESQDAGYNKDPHPDDPDPHASTFWAGGQRWDLRDQGPEAQKMGMGIDQAAFNDPNSTVSNSLYFGGSKGAANAQMADQRSKGVAAYGRAAPTIDRTQTTESRGLAAGLGDRFSKLAAGSNNSAAQMQLNRGYMDANARILAGANSARGGHLAQVVARRTAGNMIAGNAAQQGAQSRDLMATEQMNAYGQLTGLGSAMRGVDQDAAFKAADMEMRSRGINDAEQARREGLRLQIGSMGMQGQKNRQDLRINQDASIQGQNIQSDIINQAGQNRTVDTGLAAGQSAFSAAGKLVQGYGENSNSMDEARKKSLY